MKEIPRAKGAKALLFELHPEEPTGVTYKEFPRIIGHRPYINWYGQDKSALIENWDECTKGTSKEVCEEHFEPPDSYDPYMEELEKPKKKQSYKRTVVMQPHPHTIHNVLYEPPEKLYEALWRMFEGLEGEE